ncbi:facilitated trehalose transporter Tret1-like [Venturia canescens]|uniref:facilitated trehalose transporter Tret1-like n=1 Tax=Venturia canescens TaxID=32260 RepID=UPI001C9D1E39|nr:facilitated trehalose transporter Tret1-like [Venturia canescens]
MITKWLAVTVQLSLCATRTSKFPTKFSFFYSPAVAHRWHIISKMFFSIEKLPYWPQWLVALIMSLAVLVTGMGNGWTSPYLAQLTAPDATLALKLTATEASWIASILSLGRSIGSVGGAISQGCIGRKKTILGGAVPLALGWTFLMLATSVPWLYAGRLLIGTASGIVWSGLALFIGEIADPKIRGSLIFLNLNVTAIGAFLGNAIGPNMPMEHFAGVSLALTAVFAVAFALVPESPYHHILKGNTRKAEESLRWYNRRENVKAEISELQDFVGSTKVSVADRLAEFNKPVNRKNLATMMCLSIFLYGAGHNTMSYYAEIIVAKSKIGLTPSVVVMSLSFCSIIAAATATIIVDKLNRRTLLFASSIGASIAMISLGVHFHLMSSVYSASSYAWLPIFSLILYNFSLAWGLVPVPCALISEIFPPIIKTTASMSLSATAALISFTTARSFQPFLDLVGEKYVFWTFSLSSLSSALFTWIFVPETRGKSLIQIQKDMSKSKVHEVENINQKKFNDITHNA